jgi:hypothetical protein
MAPISAGWHGGRGSCRRSCNSPVLRGSDHVKLHLYAVLSRGCFTWSTPMLVRRRGKSRSRLPLMQPAGTRSWRISEDRWSEAFDVALWFRAAERIDVPAGGIVPGPAEIDPLPDRGADHAGAAELAAGWLAWWQAWPGHPFRTAGDLGRVPTCRSCESEPSHATGLRPPSARPPLRPGTCGPSEGDGPYSKA